jgi:phospholipase A1/A2
MESAIEISQGRFLKQRYTFIVPHGIEGPATIDISELNAAGVMFSIASPVSEKTPQTAAKDKSRQEQVPLDSLFKLYQPYLVNFSACQPMYFLIGTSPEKSESQISFKYQLLNPSGGLVQKFPWLQWNADPEGRGGDYVGYKYRIGTKALYA